jgi:ribonucleoside-diphosphate reductase alpha chain
MTTRYEFKYKDMRFSKDGSWDELIALDRYAVPAFEGYKVGDTVVFIADQTKQTKRVGVIKAFNNHGNEDWVNIEDRFGEVHNIKLEHVHKPLETEPYQLWERWEKGGASVEKEEKREFWENRFRWLFDGYRYSLGGRIQLMLGQEFVTGKKAQLTAYNCYVSKCARPFKDNVEQFLDVIDAAYIEASIMRRGGGDGMNISYTNTINGSGMKETDFIFYLDKGHNDYQELEDRIKLGKFKGVVVVTTKDEFEEKSKDAYKIKALDSVDGMFKENMPEMVRQSYKNKKVAIDFNDLRHRNAIVKGVNGRSSGAVSWMELFVLIANLLQQETIDNVDFAEIYSHIVHLIIQGGSRRGALMLICNVDNPNVRKFITRKRQMGYLSGANISVGIDETFMQRVKLAKRLSEHELNLDENKILKDALDIWNLLVYSAWDSAEPGIVWLERYNKESNSWYYRDLVATNPCGEQGLPEYGVCNLGHHVLPHYYMKNGSFDEIRHKASEYYYPKWNEIKDYDVDWDSLAKACHIAVRLQDNIIDYTPYFLEENKNVQLSERRVGIGTMGLATLMIKLKLRYGSDEGNDFVDKLYKFIAYQTYTASMNIAEEKGAFPKFEYEKFIQSGFMKRLLNEFPELQTKLKRTGIRNVTLLTQAPTGSTATYIDNIPMFIEKFGGTSTGIEPYYSYKYWRASRLGSTEQTVHIAQQYMDEHGITNIDDLPDYFVTSMDLTPAEHVKVQAAIQRWTDSSISKTANCPKDYTIEQVDELYMLAYDLGLKGITIYRDGSRKAQVLATNKEDAKLESHIEAEKLEQIKQQEQVSENVNEIKKRPSRLFGFTDKIKLPVGDRIAKVYITINVDENNQPFEVFITTNDAEIESLASTIGRLTTQFLRYGNTRDNLDQIVKHLRKGQSMSTLPSKVASLLEQTAYGKIKIGNNEQSKNSRAMIFQVCPDCGEKAFDKANCICIKCGSSKCN